MKYSLRSGLTGLWILILIISLSIGVIMISLFRQRVSAQLEQAATRAEAACRAISNRYDRYLVGFKPEPDGFADPRIKKELTFLLEVVLFEFDGVEGGFWNSNDGFVAYAFPTYQGSAAKRDVPEAERGRIAELASKALTQDKKETLRYEGSRESLILHACPLSAPEQGIVAWTMIRVPVGADTRDEGLMIGLAILFLFTLISGAWLLLLLRRWSRQVGKLENAIAGYPLEQLPELPDTGEKELDRIVTAINQLSTRLALAREESEKLSKRLAQSDRLAALAHEIRNPIATMRLKPKMHWHSPLIGNNSP